MARSSSVAAAGAVAAALALAGCGGSSKPPLAAVVGAATQTLTQRASTTVTLAGSTAFGPTGAPVVGRGLFDFPLSTGYSAVNLPASATRPAAPAYLVFLPTKAYLMPAAGTQALGNGKLWISIPFSGPSPSAFPHLAAQVQSLNPQLFLDEIVWGGTAATRSGGKVVSHIPLTEYTVTVDLREALVRADSPAMRRAIAEQLASGPRTVPISAWVNGSGLVTQLRPSVTGTGLGTATVTLTGFGAGFNESLPLSSQVVDLGTVPRTPLAPWIFATSPG